MTKIVRVQFLKEIQVRGTKVFETFFRRLQNVFVEPVRPFVRCSVAIFVLIIITTISFTSPFLIPFYAIVVLKMGHPRPLFVSFWFFSNNLQYKNCRL